MDRENPSGKILETPCNLFKAIMGEAAVNLVTA
jgi:hypothetical protein